MKSEKFKIIDFIRQLIVEVDKRLENFPKKEIELKQRIEKNSYDLLEISYIANSAPNKKDKINLLIRILAKIKVIDFLLNLSYDKGLINKKRYLKLAERIDDIARYTTGWMNSLIKSSENKSDDIAKNSDDNVNENTASKDNNSNNFNTDGKEKMAPNNS